MTFKQKLKFEVKSQVKKVDHSQKYVHVHPLTCINTETFEIMELSKKNFYSKHHFIFIKPSGSVLAISFFMIFFCFLRICFLPFFLS